MDHLLLNGKKFYYEEIAQASFKNSIPLNGYEVTTLEFCRNWLNGIQDIAINTSGSTGAPKIITLTRRQMEASARYTLSALNLKENDNSLVCLNTEFIGGMMMLVRGFIGNLHLTIIEPISNPFKYLPPNGPNEFAFSSFVPMQLQTILTESPDKVDLLDKMKGILVGGAPVSGYLSEKIKTLTVPVFHTYGMTETSSHIALKRLNGPNPDQYFQVTENIRIGQDDRGCLTLIGEVTDNKEIITNDLVEIHSEHSFNWLGRVDNTINSGGIKIQAEKVEVALAQVLLLQNIERRSFITTLPDPRLGQRLVAVMEGEPILPDELQKVNTALKKILDKYEFPKEFIFITDFCTTGSGKIDKHATLSKRNL